MGMSATRYFTAQDLEAMPDDGKRYELVRGELLVTPAPVPRHQSIVNRFAFRITHYLEPHGLDTDVVVAPSDVTYAFDTVVQPDLFVADMAAALRSNRCSDIATLYLAIEVLSPSTAGADRAIKRQLYQEQRIPHYWIVDGEQRHVEIWTPEATAPAIERDTISWQHPKLAVSCEIDLVRLFDFG
jgi:Uma2 family endonuclease